MKLRRLFEIRKSRNYPIQRDSTGRSLRARCFQLFDKAKRPVEVAKELGMKQSTAYKYFQQWKRLGPNFERAHAYTKELLNPASPDRDNTLEQMAMACGIPKQDLEATLAQPNGLRRLMTGKLYFPGHANASHRLNVVLQVALVINNHLMKNGKTFEDVRFAFERLLNESMEYRKEEDADIKEENEMTAITRQVLEAADKAEQEGRVKRDRLTSEEINAIIRHGLEAKTELKIRNAEKLYWLRIAELMAEGLTQEQARDKIYQDLLERGDLKGAKAMRAYQDIVHPLKAGHLAE